MGSFHGLFELSGQCERPVRNINEALAQVMRIFHSVLPCSEYIWGCAFTPGLQFYEVYLTIGGVLVGRQRMR